MHVRGWQSEDPGMNDPAAGGGRRAPVTSPVSSRCAVTETGTGLRKLGPERGSPDGRDLPQAGLGSGPSPHFPAPRAILLLQAREELSGSAAYLQEAGQK